VQPIPLSLISAGRELTEPRLSPDGEWVGFVQRGKSAASIVRVALDGVRLERQMTFGPDPSPGRGLGGGCFTWLHEPTASFVYCAVDGELWWQRGMQLERITDHGRTVRAPAAGDPSTGAGAAGDGTLVVYAVDEAEIWTTDLGSGATRRMDDGRHAFCFDPTISPDGSTLSWLGWSPPHMPWDAAERVDLQLATGAISTWRPDDAAVQQPRFAPNGEPVHVHDGSGWLNVYIGDRAIVSEPIEHAGPTWGQGNRSYALDPTGTRVAFTRNERGFGAMCVVDLANGKIDQIGRGVHGQLSWVGDSLVALRTGARTATQVVAYTTDRWQRTLVAISQPDVWPADELPEPEAIEARASDGSTLHARCFSAGHGRLLCWVHGGPTDQWQVDWRPRISYWWSRGWDVLVVDPRGTTGHGRAYQQALHGAWGRLDVDDTAALLTDAHRLGWATPATTVIIGGSSGGLTVLGVLADFPDLVVGGVASYPVSDLRALTEVTHRFEAHYTDTLVAANDGSKRSLDAFRALSPIHRAEAITRPLLLFHGADDEVVPLAQTDALVERLRAVDRDVTYIVYEGEGHGFRRPENVSDEYARTETFLERVVGAPAAERPPR
jgi:dipeptidyl aminopeptidase/acylaminoacyl peptidase